MGVQDNRDMCLKGVYGCSSPQVDTGRSEEQEEEHNQPMIFCTPARTRAG